MLFCGREACLRGLPADREIILSVRNLAAQCVIKHHTHPANPRPSILEESQPVKIRNLTWLILEASVWGTAC